MLLAWVGSLLLPPLPFPTTLLFHWEEKSIRYHFQGGRKRKEAIALWTVPFPPLGILFYCHPKHGVGRTSPPPDFPGDQEHPAPTGLLPPYSVLTWRKEHSDGGRPLFTEEKPALFWGMGFWEETANHPNPSPIFSAFPTDRGPNHAITPLPILPKPLPTAAILHCVDILLDPATCGLGGG